MKQHSILFDNGELLNKLIDKQEACRIADLYLIYRPVAIVKITFK